MAGASRSSNIDVDASDFIAGLNRAIQDIKIESHRELVALGTDIANRARELSPVDTGRLRASIDIAEGRDDRGSYIDVGTHVEYAPYVEFGTLFTRAQPFMRPAIAEAVGSWRPRI